MRILSFSLLMAPAASFLISCSFITLLSILLVPHCSSLNPNNASIEQFSPSWAPGGATWYGSPEGFGSDGGSCGYGKAVGQAPFSSFVTAAGPSVYKNGEGCGTCYEVKCSSNAACSGNPVRVVVTDLCPGGPCVAEAVHFDLSGHAFGALAAPGQADQLRTVGNLKIDHRRVECDYGGTTLVFNVDAGSNPNYFATEILYQEGDADITGVDLMQNGSPVWSPLERSWGQTWKIQGSGGLKAPFSIRITDETRKSIVANNVIPADWKPGQSYRSLVNF